VARPLPLILDSISFYKLHILWFMARNSISVNKDTMGVANEVSENELPSPATSKRAWYPWVVDPVATEKPLRRYDEPDRVQRISSLGEKVP
jgi:hypothetical protein